MQYVELVAVLAVVQYLAFGALAGQARRVSGLKAPAVTGDVGFERMYRVQMNTLETLVAFFACAVSGGSILARLCGGGTGCCVSDWTGTLLARLCERSVEAGNWVYVVVGADGGTVCAGFVRYFDAAGVSQTATSKHRP